MGRPSTAAHAVERTRPGHRVLFGVWVGLVVVVAFALILFLVLPTRTWLSQRSSLAGTERKLSALQAENAALRQRVQALKDPAEVEQLARQQYGMVRPGEKAMSMLPAAPLAQLPTTWPYSVIQGILTARSVTPGR